MPNKLNTTYIECHRHIQALRALGEGVNGYGRVLIPKILRAFPPEICQRWIVHVKRQGLSEGDILRLMEFLGEVDGALTAQKIRGETLDNPNYIPSAAALHVNSKQPRSGRKERYTGDPFCVFCESKGNWAQECKKVTEVSECKDTPGHSTELRRQHVTNPYLEHKFRMFRKVVNKILTSSVVITKCSTSVTSGHMVYYGSFFISQKGGNET